MHDKYSGIHVQQSRSQLWSTGSSTLNDQLLHMLRNYHGLHKNSCEFLRSHTVRTVLSMVKITVLLMIGQLDLTFLGLKQVIHDQTRQNGYQTVAISVNIHNLMFFSFDQVF